MLSTSELWIYIASLSAAYLLPGPDVALVMSVSSRGGFRRGMLVSLGLSCARAIHVLLSALGLAALLASHPDLLGYVRWLGGGYMVWMAWVIITSKLSLDVADTGAINAKRVCLQGLLTNLLNPKALLFCSLLLPQFVHQESDSLWVQYLLLGAVLVWVGVAFDALFAVLASRLSGRFRSSPTAVLTQKCLFSSIFLAAAIRLTQQ